MKYKHSGATGTLVGVVSIEGITVASYTFAQAFGGAANTCNTVASGGVFTSTKYVKYTCVTSTADPTAADLPTGFATIS